MDIKYSIVVPCYNEVDNIPLLLNRFREILKRSAVEVILVNNGSTDGTEKLLENILPQYPFARTTLVKENKGYGYGILQGLKVTRGKYIGWMHADMQTDPLDAVKAFRLAHRFNDDMYYFKGKRQGRPLFDRIFTNGMSIFETMIFRKTMYDINAQPNVFPRAFYEKWDNPPWDFSLDLYAYYMAKKNGMRVLRFPVKFPERIHGSSKWNTDGLKSKWKFIKRTLKYSITLKKAYG